MTQNNRETLQRAIGIIEGASYNVSTKVQDALVYACELLDSVLDDEKDGEDKNNAKADF